MSPDLAGVENTQADAVDREVGVTSSILIGGNGGSTQERAPHLLIGIGYCAAPTARLHNPAVHTTSCGSFTSGNICGLEVIGYGAGIGITDFIQCNTLIGSYSGCSLCNSTCSNVSGQKNVFIGNCSGKTITTGYCNAVVGEKAGDNGSTYPSATTCLVNRSDVLGYCVYLLGAESFASGNLARASYRSVTIGSLAGSLNANHSVHLGHQAGGESTISQGNTDQYNVFIGHRTGYENTTGCDVIAIGQGAGSADSNSLYPLKNCSSRNDRIIIGNTDIDKFYTKMSVTGSGTGTKWNTSTNELTASGSSRRYKENIRSFLKGVDEIYNINPVTFTYIERPEETKPVLGLIAEDLDEIGLTELVNYNKDNLPESIDYDKINVLLINQIKNLKSRNDEINRRISLLETA